jgi:hypothetical protein
MKCVGCGCTDERACEGGCWWASTKPPICSTCEPQKGYVYKDARPGSLGLRVVVVDGFSPSGKVEYRYVGAGVSKQSRGEFLKRFRFVRAVR